MKKLYRSRTDKTFTGLLGGIGEYFNVDPIIVRLFFVLFLFLSQFWPAVIMYIIAYFVVPLQPDIKTTNKEKKENGPRIHDV